MFYSDKLKIFHWCFLTVVLLIAVFFHMASRQKRELLVPDSLQVEGETYYNGYRLFFLRHIDTLYSDTLYSVCYLGPKGDTLRALLPLHYTEPDTTIWVNFYLRNNGDTIICDDSPELSPVHSKEQLEADTCSFDSISRMEKAVIGEIEQYLLDYQTVNSLKQSQTHDE